jgi:acyl transferase domain-containing protein
MDVFYARAGLLSADGRCRAFDAKARGIVRGEGVGLLVLKRLSRAVADGDRIHAVIRGSAVNQDGRSNGLTSPSRWSQEEVLRTAYRRANVIPGHVSYVETHGTGTLIGDPIETAALGAVMNEGRAPGRSCAIGSVKTNLGHLESAAGVASLLKAVLSLSNRTLAPSLNFEAPNPYARLEERNLRVSTRTQPWPEDDKSAVAGVSSFGMGGTNAHVVLAAADAPSRPRRQTPRASLVPMSAQSGAALDAVQRSYAELLSAERVALVDAAHSAGVRRDHHDLRRAVVGLVRRGGSSAAT